VEPREIEFKLQLAGESDFDALVAVLPGGARLARRELAQTNHYFDTRDGALHAARSSLRLREAGGAWTLTAKGPQDAGAARDLALARRAEEECAVDGRSAAELLAGTRCPLATLLARRGARASPFAARLEALVAGRELIRIGGFENLRARVGPIAVELDGRPRQLTLELDRTTFPGGRVDWEVELEVEAEDAPAAAALLGTWFRRAGLPWRPATNKLERYLAGRGADGGGPAGAGIANS